MQLKQLLSVIPETTSVNGDTDREISGVVYDPLRVERDYLYVAINI